MGFCIYKWKKKIMINKVLLLETGGTICIALWVIVWTQYKWDPFRGKGGETSKKNLKISASRVHKLKRELKSLWNKKLVIPPSETGS